MADDIDNLLARADRYRNETGLFGVLLRDLAAALREREAELETGPSRHAGTA